MVFILADTKRTSYMDYTFPLTWDLLGWSIPLVISLCIPVVAIIKIVNSKTSSKLTKVGQLRFETLETIAVQQSALSLFFFLKFGFMCVYVSMFLCFLFPPPRV